MKEYKILHLYSDTLDLYGDYFNLKCIERHISQMGLECRICTLQIDDELSADGYDMIYIGHGKARNLAAVSEHFVKYGESFRNAIEDGKLFLVTGNARLLFGRSFESIDGKRLEGIGAFDYVGAEGGKVFTSDVVSSPVFAPDERCYGFINRTQHIEGENPYPLFRLISGAGDGKEGNAAFEGTLYKNFFGTWQMGPLLPRNPLLLKELLRRLLGDDFRDFDTSLEQKALDCTLAEFSEKNNNCSPSLTQHTHNAHIRCILST